MHTDRHEERAAVGGKEELSFKSALLVWAIWKYAHTVRERENTSPLVRFDFLNPSQILPISVLQFLVAKMQHSLLNY